MKISKKISSVICDDVREEINNKFSLMGIYGKDIVFGKIPAVLPKLFLVILLEEIIQPFSEIHVTLRLPKIEPQVFKYKAPPKIKPEMNLNVILMITPFRVEEAGNARFELRIDKSKRTNYVHKFMIKEKKID